MTDSPLAAAGAPIRSTFADDSGFAELLQLFGETLPEKRDAVRALYREGSFEQLRIWAHQLKGASGGYGFPDLSDATAELELGCQSSDAERINLAVNRVVDVLNRIEV
jgi:HPt (histidine-containing phosphotransfer) domain-containing protein